MENNNNNKKRALGRGLESLYNDENLDIDNIEKQIYDSADKAAAAAGLMRSFARIVNVSEIVSGKKY